MGRRPTSHTLLCHTSPTPTPTPTPAPAPAPTYALPARVPLLHQREREDSVRGAGLPAPGCRGRGPQLRSLLQHRLYLSRAGHLLHQGQGWEAFPMECTLLSDRSWWRHPLALRTRALGGVPAPAYAPGPGPHAPPHQLRRNLSVAIDSL